MKAIFSTLILLSVVTFCKAQCTSAPPQPGSIVGIDPVCEGSTQVYYIFPVAGATSYTWTLPNGWTGSSTTTSITVTPGSTGGWMYVTATNSCGTSPAQGYSALVFDAAITASGPATFCDGDDVQLNATTGSGLFYQWFNGGSPITGATSSSYTADDPGNYTVQISTNNCFTLSDPFTVTVQPSPAIPVATNTSPVCAGTILNFSGICTTPGVTYSWTGPNNFNNNQNPAISSSQVADAGTYTLTVSGGLCSSSTTTDVVIEDIPDVSGINGANPVCEGSTIAYSVINDVSATQYYWSIPNGWAGTSTTSSITTTVDTTSGYVTVFAINNCGISDTAEVYVKVNPKPQPVIIFTGNTLTTTQPYTSYQWYNNSGPVTGATSQSYNITLLGNHFVIVTDSNGCVNQSNVLNIDGLSASSLSQQGEIIVGPNPNNGSFNINGTFPSNDGKANVSIIDVAGRIVYTKQITLKGNQLSSEISMNNSLAEGVYILRLSSDIQNTTIPFVKK